MAAAWIFHTDRIHKLNFYLDGMKLVDEWYEGHKKPH
jgi:hypothetical protein